VAVGSDWCVLLPFFENRLVCLLLLYSKLEWMVFFDFPYKGRMSGMQARTIATAGSSPERMVASTPLYVMSAKSRSGSSVCRYMVMAQVLRYMSVSITKKELLGSAHLPYSDAEKSHRS
jgi:hypothetical protein